MDSAAFIFRHKKNPIQLRTGFFISEICFTIGETPYLILFTTAANASG